MAVSDMKNPIDAMASMQMLRVWLEYLGVMFSTVAIFLVVVLWRY